MILAPGTLLGRYEITGPLGAGGMGEVYRARDSRLDRNVAIKVLPAHVSSDRDALARFERETKVLAALSHPHILTIFDVGSFGASAYAVMELLEGETLRSRIGPEAIRWRDAVEIGRAIADGLVAAHAKGIVHRDLKPENVYITAEGRVKILDFGLARFSLPGGTDPQATATAVGTVMGTPGYMSPEQIRGDPAGPASDFFALGCVLFEMVAGYRPFAGASAAESFAATLRDDPPRLQGIPPALARTIARCLKKSPTDRFQSARDLLYTLSEIGNAVADEAAPVDSVAVLPFSTASSTPDADYLSDGITESVINSLAQLAQLRVVARSTVFRHRGYTDPLEVGRSLGVRTVVTGRVFHRGEDLMISAELMDVSRGSQIWGERYRRRTADIFDIQEEISREISQQLRLKLTGEDQRRLAKRPTDDEEAYRAYLKGRYCWNQRTADGMRSSVEHFREAIDLDPAYALAYCGLGDALLMRGIYHQLAPKDAFPKAIAAARRALEFDRELAEAHATLGFAALYHAWNFGEAERELQEAIRLNPAHPSAHQWYGMCLALTGRFDHAVKEWKIAQQYDPFSASINTSAAWPLYWARRTDEALAQLRTAVDLHPTFWSAHYFLGLALAQKNDLNGAINALERANQLSDSSWSIEGLGYVYARAGKSSDAARVLAQLERLAPAQYITPYARAAIHAGLDDANAACASLDAAIDDRSWRVAWLSVDPFFDRLRGQPEFEAVLSRARAAQQSIQS